MALNKVGLNLSVFQNASIPSFSDFNLSTDASTVATQIPQKANEITGNYLGLGILVTLFFYLVFKLGDFLELNGQPYSTIRSVGISAGVCSIFGVNLLAIGYFTEYFHVVIFMGLLLVSTLWVWFDEKRW